MTRKQLHAGITHIHPPWLHYIDVCDSFIFHVVLVRPSHKFCGLSAGLSLQLPFSFHDFFLVQFRLSIYIILPVIHCGCIFMPSCLRCDSTIDNILISKIYTLISCDMICAYETQRNWNSVYMTFLLMQIFVRLLVCLEEILVCLN